MGLTTPTDAEKRFLWANLSVYQSNIKPETGGYHPNRVVEQAHFHPARFKLLAGGVRGGKSLSSAMEAVPWTFHSNLIWLAAETYDQTRQEFEYIIEAITSLDALKSYSAPKNMYQPCNLMTISGCRVETRSLKDVERFASRAPDVIIICEPGQAPPQTFERASERLSTRRGLLWMAGTFEDIKEAWMEDVWRKWVRYPNADGGKSWSVPTWLNTTSFPGGKQDPEMLRMRNAYGSLKEFLLRCVGVPVASSSLVVGDYWDARKHVNPNIEFRPVHNGAPLPVEIAIDPGFSGGSHYVVEAIQHMGATKLVIDEVALQGHVHEEVIAACKNRPWWKHVIRGVIDPYAGGSHIYGALTPQEVWQRVAGLRVDLAPRLTVDDLVSNLCNELRDPETGRTNVIVSPRCTRLIWEMTHWRRRNVPGGNYADPTKTNCDAVKALGYYLANRKFARLGQAAGQPHVSDYSVV